VAGMSAAALLGKHAKVIVVDADQQPDDQSESALPRSRTPQDQHLRAFLFYCFSYSVPLSICGQSVGTHEPYNIF